MAKTKEPKKADSKTAALNVRPFPEDLLWSCREKAARRRLHLREFVIDVLKKATAES